MAKHAGGRPSKKDKIDVEQMKRLYLDGWDDVQVSEFFGITRQTLDNWKRADREFFASIKNWKRQADERVERSLYERACGYSHKAIKFFQAGNKIISQEYIERYPPDATSMIFWLKNRQSDKWRDKQEFEGNQTLHIIVEDASASGFLNAGERNAVSIARQAAN